MMTVSVFFNGVPTHISVQFSRLFDFNFNISWVCNAVKNGGALLRLGYQSLDIILARIGINVKSDTYGTKAISNLDRKSVV